MENPNNEQQVNNEQRNNAFVQPTAATQSSQTEQAPAQTTYEATQSENSDEELIGIVADCESLNVRETPSDSAKIVTTIPVLKEVIVDENESTDGFYKISTNEGITGYCMRTYISIKP